VLPITVQLTGINGQTVTDVVNTIGTNGQVVQGNNAVQFNPFIPGPPPSTGSPPTTGAPLTTGSPPSTGSPRSTGQSDRLSISLWMMLSVVSLFFVMFY